jgi:hypothetical protein
MSTYRTKRVVKASGRRLSTIESGNEKLSIDRRVYLPFDLASVHAAAQNFRIDLAKGIHRHVDEWEDTKDSYLEEALRLLQEDGCNLYPGHNNEFWIHAQSGQSLIQMPSNRAARLCLLFDCWFLRDDPELLKDPDFPCPSKINSNLTVEKATKMFERRFEYS